MFKITSFSLLACITFSCTAMQHPNQHLQQWVQAAREIEVKTIKETISVPVNINTTVADVKQFLRDDQGIPTDQQTLYPLVNWRALGLWDTHGPQLENNLENIKEIINRNNSNRFALYLSLCSNYPPKA